MELMNNYKETILIVDLDAKECDTESLSEELVAKGLGGAGITTALYDQYKDREPLIIGTGFFTGTFMPGGCCGRGYRQESADRQALPCAFWRVCRG